MSVAVVLFIGKLVVLLGAIFHLKHLIASIMRHFDGCKDLRSTARRAFALDDVTAAGVIMFLILAVAIVLTAAAEFGGMHVGQ